MMDKKTGKRALQGAADMACINVRDQAIADTLLSFKKSVSDIENTSVNADEYENLQIKAYPGGVNASQQNRNAPLASAHTNAVVALWFASNITILLLNKYLLVNFGFGYPIFLTGCHMLACTILSEVGKYGGWMHTVPVQSWGHLLKVMVLATAFLASVVLNNVALQYIPVSFAEEIGALTPAATAALAFVFMGTVERWVTYAALIPVMLGIVMATGNELSFNRIGFAAAIGGCLARAFKSVLQAILLSGDGERLESMTLLRLMAPIAALMLVPGIAVMEPGVLGLALKLTHTQPVFSVLLLANSGLAYIVNYTNFRITKCTSALTLQVLGCSKGVLATFISVMLFGNRISALGIIGYSITVSGVFAYGYIKQQK